MNEKTMNWHVLISAGALMKDADKLKLMLLAWNYNLQQQAQASAQAQAATAALSPNNSSTSTTATTIGTPVTSQCVTSTANNTINNSTLTGNTFYLHGLYCSFPGPSFPAFPLFFFLFFFTSQHTLLPQSRGKFHIQKLTCSLAIIAAVSTTFVINYV